MAFDPDKARIANQLIRDGLDPALALGQAGVAPRDRNLYTIDEVGTPETNPNYGQLVSTSFARVQAESPDVVTDRVYTPNLRGTSVRRIRTAEETITTQTTQITGGGSTVNRVVPTQYEENSSSRALQDEANDLEAQKQARRDAIRAAGGTGADVIADPEFRRLSNAQTAKEYEAQQAKTTVPNTGGIVTTVTPGANQTTTTQTVDGDFLTNQSAGFDTLSQLTEANAAPAQLVPQATTANDAFAGDGYGFTYDEDGELLPFDSVAAEQIRSTSADTQDEFAGAGYGFVYDEDGELIPADSAEAERIRSQEAVPVDPFAFDEASLEIPQDPQGFNESDLVTRPAPPLDYSVTFEEGFGWVIVDNATGSFIETDFDSQAAAEDALREITGQGIGSGFAGDPNNLPSADNTNSVPAGLQAKISNAKQQATIQQNRNRPATSDWRVRLKLLPQADYLYKDPANAGILRPLRDQDGVIFPYMPKISTSYLANYDKYDLTHSNYRGYFYKNSSVQEVTIDGVFTAQDTKEAEYLLAVIHFFRSVTKMFYGQDKYRGAPPPLVELFGLGQYQFNYHPCLISQFSYNLPNDVDYIRTDINNFGLNLSNRQERVASSPFPIAASVQRLFNSGLTAGAEPTRRDVGVIRQTVSGLGVTTYVPTKMNIQITLLPVQNRRQISSEFSVKEFANGVLLRGGFW